MTDAERYAADRLATLAADISGHLPPATLAAVIAQLADSPSVDVADFVSRLDPTDPADPNPDRRHLVVLKSGEALVAAYDDDRGVHTDAGCHPWDECVAYRIWSPERDRWLTIPLH